MTFDLVNSCYYSPLNSNLVKLEELKKKANFQPVRHSSLMLDMRKNSPNALSNFLKHTKEITINQLILGFIKHIAKTGLIIPPKA